MTREECESQIIAKLAEIREIAAEYMEREPTYLTMLVTHEEGKTGSYSCNNCYWSEDGDDNDKPINGWEYYS